VSLLDCVGIYPLKSTGPDDRAANVMNVFTFLATL
jgi:hypothetical protein